AIPVFRLPGLASGAILLRADLAAFGQGTVTVEVRSLTDARLVASATATVTAEATTAATTTQVRAAPNPVRFGAPVTLTAIVSASQAGAGVPTGSVQFRVDGIDFGPAVALSAGVATFQDTARFAAGPHVVSALYTNTDGRFAGSLGVLDGGLTVEKAA